MGIQGENLQMLLSAFVDVYESGCMIVQNNPILAC